MGHNEDVVSGMSMIFYIGWVKKFLKMCLYIYILNFSLIRLTCFKSRGLIDLKQTISI